MRRGAAAVALLAASVGVAVLSSSVVSAEDASVGSLNATSLGATAMPGSVSHIDPLKLANLFGSPEQVRKWRPGRRDLLDLSLADLRKGKAVVPPVYLSRFPTDLSKVRSPKERKDLFIKTVLPLVLRANHEVLAERRRMLALIALADDDRGGLTPEETEFLNRLAVEYDVPGADLSELQQRVDVVPASLALAQGAEESGWGTSRFARLGNAVFGQRTFRKGLGLVPLRREKGKRHEVKAFHNLYKSVREYVWNLNTHFAYEKFRAKRAAFRNDGLPLDGYALTSTLSRYSERGQKYVKTIRIIMRSNRLRDFDALEFDPKGRLGRPS